MMKPRGLIFRPATQPQNGPVRLYSDANRPSTSAVPISRATTPTGQ